MIIEDLKTLQFKNYDARRERIDYENRRGIALILAFYTIIVIINIVMRAAQRVNILTDRSLILEIVYMAIAVPLYFLVFRKRKVKFTVGIYLIEVPLLLITIIHGTIWDPNHLTITFLLFLLAMPVLILDKPWRVLVLIFSMTVVYIGMDFSCKRMVLFEEDLLHVCNACFMSVAISLYTLIARIKNLDSAGYYAEKANYDPLTGLYNRFGAKQRMVYGKPGLMIYLDLDRFKEANDAFGHEAGDRVLRKTADALRSCFRKDDILVRMGGDEFVVFAPGIWTEDKIHQKLTDVLQKIKSIHASDKDKNIAMTVSMGCAYTPDGSVDVQDLLREADEAMYAVKHSGKDGFKIVDRYQTKNI